MGIRGSFFLFAILILGWVVPLGSASENFNFIISNSENWKDVYSIIHFATLRNAGSDFLVSTRHGPLLVTSLNKNSDIRVISSRRQPFSINYADFLRSKGFTNADEITVNNANLELIDELPNINNFVIVGTDYGYDAIAVIPYAVQKKSWVFLADRNNIDEITTILNGRSVKEILVYGYVDREVREGLARFNPSTINSGDRFLDNIEIVKKFIEIKPMNQVLLSNGEFIEKEIMTGAEPVLFTGKENVPDQIRDYLKSSKFEVGVLVGSDLVGAATNIRRTTGISVIVKFARSARAPTGNVAAVEGLDLFYIPVPIVRLDLYSVKYNKANSQLEVTYNSSSNVPLYLKGTVTIRSSDGETNRVGDLEPVFLAPGDFKTIIYPDLRVTENSNATIFTIYGITSTSLDKILDKTIPIEFVNVLDKCKVESLEAKYNKMEQEITIKVKNSESVGCYADGEIKDIIIDDVKTTIGAEKVIYVNPGKTANLIIKQELTDVDLAKNKDEIWVFTYSGERENSLVHTDDRKLKLSIFEISSIMIAIIIVVILLIIFIILFFLWRRRKKDEED